MKRTMHQKRAIILIVIGKTYFRFQLSFRLFLRLFDYNNDKQENNNNSNNSNNNNHRLVVSIKIIKYTID